MLSLVIILAAILVLPRFQIIQTLTDDLNRVARENLKNIIPTGNKTDKSEK